MYQAVWLLERKGMEENAGGEGMTPGDGCVVWVAGQREFFCSFDSMLRYRKVGLILLKV